jgi:5'-methylthioadenosine phosphorylase
VIEMTNGYAEIGIFGGSGFYSFLENVTEAKIDTPYGAPSDSVTLAEIYGRKVAFLPRHGRNHTLPPHKINFRANIWAFHQLGVKTVISPCAVGSLQKHIEPGHFVVCDQFIDRTSGREHTFYDGPIVTHVSSADIYHKGLRKLAIQEIKRQGIVCHETGTVVVIQGPRYSTKAESTWFTRMGWDVINMTQYPEAYLCHELGMNVVNIALATDYDSGVVSGTEAVQSHDVLAVFQSNSANLRRVVMGMIENITDELLATNVKEELEYTRGDGHAASEKDIRLFVQ